MENRIEKHLLESNAEKTEKINYFKQYSSDELLELKDNLADTSILINDIEIEKKETMDLFKEKLNPHRAIRKELLTNIKQKGETINEECFVMVDTEEKKVGYYNHDGVLVYERPCMPSEMQKTIFQVGRTGTNN